MLAGRLMQKANITLAQVLESQSEEEQQKFGGLIRVRITRNDGKEDGLVNQNIFVGILCDAMEKFFHCESFTQSYTPRTKLDIVFYGVATNATLAAEAFERNYNDMLQWARNGGYKGIRGQNSYCIGISEELLERAEKEREAEEAAVIAFEKNTEAERKRQERRDKADLRAREKRLARSSWTGGYDSITKKSRGASGTSTRGSTEAKSERSSARRDSGFSGNERIMVFLAILKIVSVNKFTEGRANYSKVIQAIDYHILDYGQHTTFEIDEADNIVRGFVDDGHFIHSDDGTLTISSCKMRRELRSSSSDSDSGYDDDDILGEDEEDSEEADFHVNETNSLNSKTSTNSKKDISKPAGIVQKINDLFWSKKPASVPKTSIEPTFKTKQQLDKNRENLKRIGENVLKEHGIELRTGRKRKMHQIDDDAYAQGRIDGKKIDVHRRKRIRA